MGLPVTPTYVNFAYDTDLLIDFETPYTGSVRTRIDPTSLEVGDADNTESQNNVNLPIPLVFGKKKRGIWPRHVTLLVTNQGATKGTITKIPILTAATAQVILTLGTILEPEAFGYSAYTGTIKLVGYAQEYYFRVFEEVESSSGTPGQLLSDVSAMENTELVSNTDAIDFAAEYQRRVRELDDWYRRVTDAKMARGEGDFGLI